MNVGLVPYDALTQQSVKSVTATVRVERRFSSTFE
jgi:hypothetical protein